MAPALPAASIDRLVRDAVAASNLRTLPDAVIDELAAGARRMRIDAGVTLRHEDDDEPHLELVIDGLIRVHVSASDGRTMTVRYCRTGALIGAPTLYASQSPPFAIQALATSELLRFRPEVVRRHAERDLRVATALLTEMSERVFGFVAELSASSFASVRDRVGRHLLDLAAEQQRGDQLVAEVSQQQLADAVGTVREVVVRILRELRAQGIVETGRGAIRIRDPERLVTSPATGSGGQGGTEVP